MAQADITKLKAIREKTKAGIADIRRALEETDNNEEKAIALIREWGVEKAAAKGDREVAAGLVESYIHAGGRVGALVEIACETDFVAKTDEFKMLCKEVAMQVSAMNPKDVETLLKQDYIRDSKVTIEQMVKETIAKLGENIQIKRFARFEVGQE